MVCTCGNQMVQYKEIGGGVMQDHYYETWELKHCKRCGRYVIETYVAKEVTMEEAQDYHKAKTMQHLIKKEKDAIN